MIEFGKRDEVVSRVTEGIRLVPYVMRRNSLSLKPNKRNTAMQETDNAKLAQIIEDFLRKEGFLPPDKTLHSVHITLKKRPHAAISIKEEAGTQAQSNTPTLGLKRLRLIEGLSPTAVSALTNAGINTVAAICKLSLDQALAIEGVTRSMTKRIYNVLTSIGAQLDWKF